LFQQEKSIIFDFSEEVEMARVELASRIQKIKYCYGLRLFSFFQKILLKQSK